MLATSNRRAVFFNGHLLATAGFRVDGNSNFGKEVSPAWSVAIPLEKISTTLRGSYSEGFRAPSFNDLFFPNFGDPNLQAEVSSEYDGGFTTNFGERASFTATYFSRRVKNLIVAVPCPTCLFGSQAGNAGRVDTQGVEIVPSVTIVKGLTFGGNVTVLDETHKDAPGSTARPLRVAKHTASALLQYQRSGVFREHDRITANVNYIFVGDRDDITLTSGIAIIRRIIASMRSYPTRSESLFTSCVTRKLSRACRTCWIATIRRRLDSRRRR